MLASCSFDKTEGKRGGGGAAIHLIFSRKGRGKGERGH